MEVKAIGELARTRRKELGSYVPTGNWIEGRPVYGNEEGEPRYLRLAEGKPGWGIGPSPALTVSTTCSTCLGGATLKSGRGTLSPGSLKAGPSVRKGQQGWQWKDGRGNWRESIGRLIVTCHSSNTEILPGMWAL